MVRLRKYISKYLPNLLELSFLMVFALPNASNIGLADNILLLILFLTDPPVTCDKYCKHCLVASVLPAPDSPDIIID